MNPKYRTATCLDQTPEKKLLERMIAGKEAQLAKSLDRLEQVKAEIAQFREEYDERIRPLHRKLDDLEHRLFKIYNIGDFIDEHMSYEEAQQVFDETMNTQYARMEEEYVRVKKEHTVVDRKQLMNARQRQELKDLFRRLARKFHPDRNGGDGHMMTLINKAYAEGDIETLRDLEMEHIPEERQNATLAGLKRRLTYLMQMIKKTGEEMRALRKSDMYILRRNLLKNHTDGGNLLDALAGKIEKEIARKQDQLDAFMEKVGRKSDAA